MGADGSEARPASGDLVQAPVSEGFPAHDGNPRRRRAAERAAYYDVPMLKPPTWSWEVPGYLFLGGLSGAAFVIARLADRAGGGRFPEPTRTGIAVAAAALVACPPLLIADLGDPKRFHYMLRVFKPESPMSVGVWTITAFSGALGAAGLREVVIARREAEASARAPSHVHAPGGRLLMAAIDGAGVPLGLLMAAYTGVLLSTTSVPVWSRNTWLGVLFSASAFRSASSAIELARRLQVAGGVPAGEGAALERIEGASGAAEVVALAAYLLSAGELAAPLVRGGAAATLWAGAVGGGIAAPALLDRLPARSPRGRRWKRILSLGLGLAGGYALRAAIVRAGTQSSNDPEAARTLSKG